MLSQPHSDRISAFYRPFVSADFCSIRNNSSVCFDTYPILIKINGISCIFFIYFTFLVILVRMAIIFRMDLIQKPKCLLLFLHYFFPIYQFHQVSQNIFFMDEADLNIRVNFDELYLKVTVLHQLVMVVQTIWMGLESYLMDLTLIILFFLDCLSLWRGQTLQLSVLESSSFNPIKLRLIGKVLWSFLIQFPRLILTIQAINKSWDCENDCNNYTDHS